MPTQTAQQCVDIPALNDIFASNTNLIEGRILESLSIQTPWFGVFDTDTFPAHRGDVLRTVVQEPVAPVMSECAPSWGTFSCRQVPREVLYGSTDYSYQLEKYFERGQPICITDAYTAVEDAVRRTEESMVQHARTVWNAWFRYHAFRDSATKVVARSTASSFEALVSDGFQTNFAPGVTPNSGLSWEFLELVLDYATQSLFAPMFGSGVDAHARLITDASTAHALRNQAETNLRAGVQGGFRDKYDDLYGYMWKGPYRGIAIGVDQTILRATSVNANGSIVCVEPRVAESTTRGQKAVISPYWSAAPYQVSFLVFPGAFERLIPQLDYTGSGMARFPRQHWGGDVFWINNKDNDCNILGDWGYYATNYAASFKPLRPQFVIPILHLRCQNSLGLTPCTGQYYITAAV